MQRKLKNKKVKRLKAISLYPMKPERALSLFMKIKPEQLKRAVRLSSG
jgi:hypothetical protein